MEDLIIEYINDHLTISLNGDIEIMFNGKFMYYEDVETHLMKLFNLNKYEVEGYLVYLILQMNPDFYYSHWRFKEKPPEPEWVIQGEFGRFVGGMDMANDDGVNAIVMAIYAMRENGVAELVHPARDLGE